MTTILSPVRATVSRRLCLPTDGASLGSVAVDHTDSKISIAPRPLGIVLHAMAAPGRGSCVLWRDARHSDPSGGDRIYSSFAARPLGWWFAFLQPGVPLARFFRDAGRHLFFRSRFRRVRRPAKGWVSPPSPFRNRRRDSFDRAKGT
jgi:hypothetical protein